MRKICKRMLFLTVAVIFFYCGGLLADKDALHNELIRLHVVVPSDSSKDQNIILLVRDAVLHSLRQSLSNATDLDQAREYIQAHIPQMEAAANAVLLELGIHDRAVVMFSDETFSSPSGVFESLKVTIGEGKGKNRWCMIFPSLWATKSNGETADIAAGAGFLDGCSEATAEEPRYKIRFYLLNILEKLENFFFGE